VAATLLGDLVYPCGQVPVAADGSTPAGIEAQTRQCLDNLQATLTRAGSGADRVLQVTVYLADQGDFEAYDTTWREWFSGMHLPPRTTVFVAGFRGDKRIELTAVAARGQGGEG
jgi:2-iminobutanoate/2-iminopropanoate deaminase